MIDAPRMRYLVRSLAAIAALTLLELWRSRTMLACLAAMALLLGLGEASGALALFDGSRINIDTGLAALSLACVATAVASGQGLVARDLGRDGAQVLLAQPLPRGLWLLGRFLGVWTAIVGLTASMGLMQTGLEFTLGRELPRGYTAAVAAVPLEAGVALAVAMALGCMATRALAAAGATTLILAGYMSQDVINLVSVQAPELLPTVRGLCFSLPQMASLNLRPWAARNMPTPGGLYAWATLYAVGYSAIWLWVGAWAAHRRR